MDGIIMSVVFFLISNIPAASGCIPVISMYILVVVDCISLSCYCYWSLPDWLIPGTVHNQSAMRIKSCPGV